MEDTNGPYTLPELNQAVKVGQQAYINSLERISEYPVTINGGLFDHRLSSSAHSTSPPFHDILNLMSYKISTTIDDVFSKAPIPATHSLVPNALDSMGSRFARQPLHHQETRVSPPSLEYPMVSLPIYPYHHHDHAALNVDAFLDFDEHPNFEDSKISAWVPNETSVASLTAAANDAAPSTPSTSPSTCASPNPPADNSAIMMGYLPGSTTPTIAATTNTGYDVSPRGKRRASEYSDDDDLPASTDGQSTVDDPGAVSPKRLTAWKPRERSSMARAASPMALAQRQPTNPKCIGSPTSSTSLSLSPPITQSRLSMSPSLQADYRSLSLHLSDVSSPTLLYDTVMENASPEQQDTTRTHQRLQGLTIAQPEFTPDQPQYFQPAQYPQNHLLQSLPGSYATIHPSNDTVDGHTSIINCLMSGAGTADGSNLSSPTFGSSQLHSPSDSGYFGYHTFHLQQVHQGLSHAPLRHSLQSCWYSQAQAQRKQRTRRQSDGLQVRMRQPPHTTPHTTPQQQQHVNPLEHPQKASIPKPSISSHIQVLGPQDDKTKVPFTVPDIDSIVRHVNPEEQGTQSDDESITTLRSSQAASQASVGGVRTTHRRSYTGPPGFHTGSPDSMRTLISEISRTSRKASQPQHHIQPTASSTIADMSGFLEAHKQALYTNHLVLDSGFKFSTTESMPSTNTANVHDTIQPHQGIDMDVRGTVNSKSDTGSSNDDYKMRTNRRGAAGKSRASKNVCDKCGRVYTRPFNLRSHRLTHDDKKPFGCQSLIGIKGCILHFTRRHDLIRHVRAKHPGVHWSNNGTNNPDTPEAVASAVTTSVTEERVREEELDKASEAFAAFITTAAITEEEHVKEEVLDTESESFAAFITTAAIIEEEHVKEEVPDTGSEAFAAFTATAAVIEEEHVKEEELESEASATFIATARTWKRRNS